MILRWVIVLAMTFWSCHALTQTVDDLDDDFDALDAELERAFEDKDAQLEKAFVQVKLAVDRAYQGLTQKIQVNWGEDVALPNKSQWTTYSQDYNTRVSFDFEAGAYRVETVVGDDIANSLLQLKKMASHIANSKPSQLRQQDVLYQQVNVELAKQAIMNPQLVGLTVTTPEPPDYIDVEQVLPIDIDALVSNITTAHIQTNPSIANQYLEAKNFKHAAADPETLGSRNNAPLPHTVLEDAADTNVEPEKLSIEDTVANVPKATLEAVSPLSEEPSEQQQHNLPVDDAGIQDVGKQSIAAVEKNDSLNTQASVTLTPLVSAVTESTPKKAQKNQGQKLVLTIPFVNEYQQTLIETRLDTVQALALEYGVDASLIMAVIETESSFNPMATSPIPAFGLMQLVPSTGAVDAYQFVYGEKKVVSPEFLYNQDNNLRLGTAYLHLLSNRYLGGITDPMSRLYCVLASYNIGVGNLAYTLIDRKAIRQAVKKANTMDADSLYQFLQAELPAQETRNYLVKVLDRKRKYNYLDDPQL